MVATGKLLLFLAMFALAGLALGLFLFVAWPADLSAEELDLGTSGGIVNQKGGALVNSGTFNQDGEGVFANLTGGKIINSGRINMFVNLLDNRGTIENTGTIEIFHFGAYQSLAGKLENKTGGALVIAGTVTNLNSSTINNYGSTINDRNLVNAGRMNNLCGGTVTVCSIN